MSQRNNVKTFLSLFIFVLRCDSKKLNLNFIHNTHGEYMTKQFPESQYSG